MWIGPTQDKIADVAAKLGVETFMQYHKGRKIVEIERTISTYNSDIPSIGIRDIIDLQLIIWKLEGMAKQISDAAPQDYPNAQSFDIISLSQYLSDRIRPATKKLIQIATRVRPMLFHSSLQSAPRYIQHTHQKPFLKISTLLSRRSCMAQNHRRYLCFTSSIM